MHSYELALVGNSCPWAWQIYTLQNCFGWCLGYRFVILSGSIYWKQETIINTYAIGELQYVCIIIYTYYTSWDIT